MITYEGELLNVKSEDEDLVCFSSCRRSQKVRGQGA